MNKDFVSLRENFFTRVVGEIPEDATALGIPTGALGDRSLAALAATAVADRDLIDTLGNMGPLDADEELDKEAMLALSRFRLHLYEDGFHFRNVDASGFLYATLQYQSSLADSAGEWTAITERLNQVERALGQQEELLREGVKRGLSTHRKLTQHLCDSVIPGAVGGLGEEFVQRARAREIWILDEALEALEDASENARMAYEDHLKFLHQEVLPHASEDFALGEEEYVFRLECGYGITEPIEDLIAAARTRLDRVQERLIEQAAKVAPSVPGVPNKITTLAAAAEVAVAVQSEQPSSPEEVVALYTTLLERAQRFVEEHGLFRLSGEMELSLEVDIPGLPHAHNWPAPLLDTSKKGMWALQSDPAFHSLNWAADVAVHEGIPGHYLQSFAWQQAFAGHTSPVRFLGIPDFVGLYSHYWGSIFATEGWAVYAEGLMSEFGFFNPKEELCVLVSDAIREVRVIADMSLHTGRMTQEEAAAYLRREACANDELAQMEAFRYTWIPVQGPSYALGRAEIVSLREALRAQQGVDFDLAEFHSRLLGYGPVPPARLRPLLLG